jgi:hypothetical protein
MGLLESLRCYLVTVAASLGTGCGLAPKLFGEQGERPPNRIHLVTVYSRIFPHPIIANTGPFQNSEFKHDRTPFRSFWRVKTKRALIFVPLQNTSSVDRNPLGECSTSRRDPA